MPQERVAREKLGATVIGPERTHFRVWAPRRKDVAVECRSANGLQRHVLQRHANGYFTGTVAGVGPGDRYRFALDGGVLRPDPASRFQPDGVHGDSQIIDPLAYRWQDAEWPGVPKDDLIIYELHIGLFTEQGTFAAATSRIGELQELGISAVEVLPVAQSPGRWNWGYDGVGLYAVRETFGTPDDFRAFVDACHAAGIAVILDVVYNHLGPEGNYLADFGPYFSRKHHTPWGEAFNFDGRRSEAVRQFIVDNAVYWLDEYHLDGLRLDAVRCMFDDSETSILEQLREAVSEYASAVKRPLHLIAEANVYDEQLLSPSSSERLAYDAIWCDDIMHSISTIAAPDLNLSSRHYAGAADLAESLNHGFIYAGPQDTRVSRDHLSSRQSETSDLSHLPSLVVGIQTHDCVGNHPHGKRIHHLASKNFQKAAAPLVLLYPTIPIIFMGEERAAESPFRFFVDFHDPHLRQAIDRGREREHPQHVWQGAISPSDERAFYNSKCLEPGDNSMLNWYQSLIQLRKRWRQQGWLDHHLLNVQCDPKLHLFSFRYQIAGGRDLFVVARLLTPDKPLPDVMIRIEGEITLDSLGSGGLTQQRAVALNEDRAIIGNGQWRLSP